MSTLCSDLISQTRGALEDWGHSVTSTFTLTANDASGTIYQLPRVPISSSTLPTLTDNGTAKTYGTHFTVNYNNGELTVLYTQTSAHVLSCTYTVVLYRDERILTGIQNGIRRLYPRVYKTGECYIAGNVQQFVYDLQSTTDVPVESSWGSGTVPSDYVASVARADLAKVQARIHRAEFMPVGWVGQTSWRPFNNFTRTTTRDWSSDSPFSPGDVIKLIYSSPCTVPQSVDETIDVPDAYVDLPVWYALGQLLDRKESVRVRSDSYQTSAAANANPVGAQRMTATDYMNLYWTTLRDNPMRPQATTIHYRVPSYARRFP